MPFLRDAANLSRMRSPMTSRSKWGEGQEDIEREPAHRGGGVERLGYAHKADVLALEGLDELGEIYERARQAVDLVDDNDVNCPCSDIGKELFQGRPL
jgi:hypothetical protein